MDESDLLEEMTQLDGILYLGSSKMHDPTSEGESI
jgi:hypothetical protein